MKKQRRGFTLLEVLAVFAVVLVLGGVVVYMRKSAKTVTPVANLSSPTPSFGTSVSPTPEESTKTSSSPALAAGEQLSNRLCTGSGTVPLSNAPMRPADISIIEPYGLTVGGHVTPVDHEYYWAKNNSKDSSDVLALADGKLVDIEYRDHHGEGAIPGDYRVVISYSCTFMSYFDLATSLAPDIASQLPSGWEKNGHTSINIAVKAGQAIAKMGGQSLDFAIWDTTKVNPKLLVPEAYAAEGWKQYTVRPLDYFPADVKAAILPFYVRQSEPRDGDYAYDVDGKAIGSWFLQGTKGYGGVSGGGASGASYWTGHLAIAPDFIDPSRIGFSIGDYQGEATQFTVKMPATDPATIGVETGLVKYQLLHTERYTQNGKSWNGLSTPTSALSLPVNGAPLATVLLQLTDAKTMKVELFPGKTPNQVTGFDSAVKIYTRSGN